MLARAYGFLGMLEAVAAMAAFFWVLHLGGWHYGDLLGRHSPLYLQATTACLGAIIAMQVGNVFICKQPQQGLFGTALSDNPLILAGILLEVLLILGIVYTPWGNAVFGTAPLSGEVWLFIMPFVVGMIVLEECRKWLVRRFGLFPIATGPTKLRKQPKNH